MVHNITAEMIQEVAPSIIKTHWAESIAEKLFPTVNKSKPYQIEYLEEVERKLPVTVDFPDSTGNGQTETTGFPNNETILRLGLNTKNTFIPTIKAHAMVTATELELYQKEGIDPMPILAEQLGKKLAMKYDLMVFYKDAKTFYKASTELGIGGLSDGSTQSTIHVINSLATGTAELYISKSELVHSDYLAALANMSAVGINCGSNTHIDVVCSPRVKIYLAGRIATYNNTLGWELVERAASAQGVQLSKPLSTPWLAAPSENTAHGTEKWMASEAAATGQICYINREVFNGKSFQLEGMKINTWKPTTFSDAPTYIEATMRKAFRFDNGQGCVRIDAVHTTT